MVFAQTRLKVAEAQYTSADIIYTGQWTHGGAVELHTQRLWSLQIFHQNIFLYFPYLLVSIRFITEQIFRGSWGYWMLWVVFWILVGQLWVELVGSEVLVLVDQPHRHLLRQLVHHLRCQLGGQLHHLCSQLGGQLCLQLFHPLLPPSRPAKADNERLLQWKIISAATFVSFLEIEVSRTGRGPPRCSLKHSFPFLIWHMSNSAMPMLNLDVMMK